MGLLFDRKVKVIVTNSFNRVEIENLRISFVVKKDDDTSQNVLEATIYNMNRNSRIQFEEKDATIELFAGYDGVAQLIFKGDLTWSVHTQNDSDWQTKIQAHDGAVALRESFVSDSFKAGTTVKQVLQRTAQGLGIAIKELPADLQETFSNGYSVVGASKKVLDKLKKSFNLDWSIQNGELQVTRKNTTTKDVKVIINATTGMLGSPEVLTGDGDVLKKDPNLREGGLRVKSLLNHQLTPGRLMEVDSVVVSGNYKILSVEHHGDTHGDVWHSIVKAEVIS